MVAFSAQGHINTMFRLGKRLVSECHQVTFTTNEVAQSTSSNTTVIRIHFEFFSDGLNLDYDCVANMDYYMESIGKQFPKKCFADNENPKKLKWVLGSSFQKLKIDIIKSMHEIHLTRLVGLLFPSSLLGKDDETDVGVDLFKSEDTWMEWLNQQKPSLPSQIEVGGEEGDGRRRLGKRLVSKGLQVTLATNEVSQSNSFTRTIAGVDLEFFSDGLSLDYNRVDNMDYFMESIGKFGPKNLSALIQSHSKKIHVLSTTLSCDGCLTLRQSTGSRGPCYGFSHAHSMQYTTAFTLA
ncbi:hypothetical protein RJ639_022328 [Escallonia herrerae]|uniref:Uncharacterized protein n=1 Tax=Escallonia herrerae TaxID=1293975 RepID=A0AA89AGM0_9ASTE|nr:hypothetical protein RJ639_022328 [Escallonia herrerae]